MAVVLRSLVFQVQVGLVVMMIICSRHGSKATSTQASSAPVPTETTEATSNTPPASVSTSQPAETKTTAATTAPHIFCNETKTPDNGNTSYSNNSRVVNTTVAYTCNVGYELDDTNNRTCTTNGTWDGADPTCIIKVCENVTKPANGGVNYSIESRVVDTKATYTCNPGYDLKGANPRTCTVNGTWDGSDPHCDIKVCENVTKPANGIASYSNRSRVVGTTVTYTCIPGYDLNGTNLRSCTVEGTWDGSDPHCDIKVCATADIPANGNVSYSDESRIVGTKVMYICKPGYKLNGSVNRTCTEEGEWDGADPSCDIKVCAAADIPPNGNIVYLNNSRVVNTTATYNCDAGYKLNGTNIRTCTEKGEWDGVDPRCDLIVYGHNDTCLESGPDGQCSTENASCLVYGDGMEFKCRCTEEDYYHQTNDSCLKRPVAPFKVNLNMKYINKNDFFVIWTANNDNQTDFRVIVFVQSSLNQTLKTVNSTWNDEGNLYMVGGLKSGTEYRCLLYLERKSIRTILLDSVSGYTKPERVKTMRFEDVWEKNFTVVWDNDPARPCNSYNVSLNNDRRVPIPRTNDTSQNYTFTNLTGGTSYVVTITAEVPWQSSIPLNNTSLTRPEPVSNVSLTQVLSNAVTLQLTGLESKEDGYKIYVTPNISDSVENPITSHHDVNQIGGLDPGTEYTFKVYTYINDLDSERYITVSTYTRPRPPDDLTVQDVLEDSLQLHWTLPEWNSFDEYILEYRTADSEEVNVSIPFNKTESLQYPVQNLTSGTGYIFNLYTVIKDVRSNEPATISAFTRPEGPGIPTFKQRFETSIVIEFRSNLSSYNGYQIDGTFYEKGNDTITVTGLNPGTDYTFTIFTVANFTVTSLDNITFDSFTRPTHPTTANFTDSELHETSLTVTWDAVTNGSVDGYLVYLNTNSINSTSMSSNESSEITTATFSNLTTGTQYTVNIYSYWRGEESDDSLEQTIYTRPTAPRGYISHVTESNLTVAFNGPEVDWLNFMIKVTSVSNSDPRTFYVSLGQFPYTIEDLTVGTNYTVEVYSIIDVIVGENALILSSYTKPEAVRPDNITADPSLTTSTLLAIEWALPTEGSVEWYEIQYKCTSPNNPTNMVPSYTNRSNTTTSTVSRLDPGTVCTVNITSYIGNQQGATTQKRIDWSTDENAPDKVQGMNVVAGARNLTVTWNSPLAPNGIIREYRVDVVDLKENCIRSRTIYTCSDCSESSNQRCGQDGSSQVSTPLLCKSANETKLDLETKDDVYELLVPNLHPYRNYTVEITPSTRCNGSTTLVSKLTQQAAPTGEPINVTQSMPETSNTTLSLTWYPPVEEQQNGIITNYTVYITYNNRTCYGEPEGNELYKQMMVKSTVGEASNSVDIPHLFPFWVYSIAVSASTVIGEGPNTTEVTMMTNQSAPDVIRSAPSTVNTSSSSTGLEWKHPCYVNGIITKYRIHVFSLDDQDTVTVYETQTNETRDVIGGLKPYHNYTISVAAINIDNETGPAYITTEVLLTNTGVPFKPTNIRPSAVSAKSLKIQWDKPSLYTGITMYNITVKDVSNSAESHVSTGWDFNHNETVVAGLDEYWNYTVTVTAITRVGTNTSLESTPTQTSEAAPGRVVNLNLTTEMNVTKSRSIHVVWEKPAPRDLNGVLTSYFVKYTSGTQGINVTDSIDHNRNELTITKDIKPGPYNVTVFAATSAGNGSIVKEDIIVPPGAPLPKPENASVPLMKEASAVDVDDDKTQIAIELPTDFLCDDSNGQPIQYGLIVASADHVTDEQFVGSKADFDKKIKSTYTNWFQIRDMDKPTPYITTPDNWLPCQKRRKRDVTVTPKPFTIGAGGECSGIPADQNCNGQLKPATSYRIKSYVCTAGGCSETLYSAPIKTKPGVPVAAIVAGVLAAVAVSLIVIGVAIFLKRRHAACFAKSEEAGTTHARPDTIPGTEMVTATSSSKVFRQHPVQLSEFPEFVDKMKKDSGLLFSDAYKNLRENSPKHPMARAESQNCRPKNRYTNILPYDHSRVKLLPLDDEDDTDYINASYIPGYTSRREYIATQGPMPATFDDFWRMVWEQNVEIVVMLTKLMEKGRNKCDKYWPDQNEPQFYGDLSVSVMSESNLSDYTIRIMEVKLKDNTRTVKQMSFLKWPDMGCPEYPGLLLDFVKHVRQHQTAQFKDRPMVVHCSAGVGRTGTFIAVDHLLQHIRDHDEVDIYGLVAEMRNNRCNMVQTEDQYIYIHECIREFISNDDVDEDEDDDEHLYANTPTENVYENTGFSNNF